MGVRDGRGKSRPRGLAPALPRAPGLSGLVWALIGQGRKVFSIVGEIRVFFFDCARRLSRADYSPFCIEVRHSKPVCDSRAALHGPGRAAEFRCRRDYRFLGDSSCSFSMVLALNESPRSKKAFYGLFFPRRLNVLRNPQKHTRVFFPSPVSQKICPPIAGNRPIGAALSRSATGGRYRGFTTISGLNIRDAFPQNTLFIEK